MDRAQLFHNTDARNRRGVPETHHAFFRRPTRKAIGLACTATVNTSFGCKVVVSGNRGVVLNNQMTTLSAARRDKLFRADRAEANATRPANAHSRSMCPTIVLKDGKPILSVGAAGGPTSSARRGSGDHHTIDFGMDRRRLWPNALSSSMETGGMIVEKRMGDEAFAPAEKRGHKLKRIDSSRGSGRGASSTGRWLSKARTNPRVKGKAAGW